MFTYQMGSLSRPKIHARLAEIHRQQLPVDIGEMQQRDIAERRYVVELGRGLRLARSRPQAGARRGGQGEEPEKFAAPQNYWFPGQSASRSSAASHLICSSVSVPESPSRGICEQRLYALAL